VKLGLGGIVSAAVVVLLVIYVYNAFIAEKGKSIANLGEKKP
jgi:hypothetical protein